MNATPILRIAIDRVETIINVITLAIVVLIAVGGYFVFARLQAFFSSETELDTFAWTRVEGAAENDQLTTGFLAIDMLWVRFEGRWYSLAEVLKRDQLPSALAAAIYDEPAPIQRDEAVREFRRRKAERVRGNAAPLNALEYCAHSYEVVIGYPSLKRLRAQLAQATTASGQPAVTRPSFPEPRILALNIANSRAVPPDLTGDCMDRNLADRYANGSSPTASRRGTTETALWDIMDHDGVKAAHLRQGQLAAATLVDAITGSCGAGTSSGTQAAQPAICWRDVLTAAQTPEELAEFEPAERLGLAADAAGIGALQITVSTLFGMDTAWRPWYWFDTEGVYLQRDVTQIVYGSPAAPVAVHEPRRLLGERMSRVVMRRPTVLSRDRQTSFALQTGKGVVWERVAESAIDENLAAYVTRQINGSIAAAESSIRDRAVVSAEALIRQRVMSWFDGRVGVEFLDSEESTQRDAGALVDFAGGGSSQ